MRSARCAVAMLVCALIIPAWAAPAKAAGSKGGPKELRAGLISCAMRFDLKGWSAFYKTAKGEGAFTCDNGETATTRIKARGGGITFGKSDIINGTGKFSGARSVDELFGAYAQAEVHAGAGASVAAQALTKGEISLVLSGTGRGVDLGLAFGKFTLR